MATCGRDVAAANPPLPIDPTAPAVSMSMSNAANNMKTELLPTFRNLYAPSTLPVHAVMALPRATDLEFSKAVTTPLPVCR